MTLVHLHTHSEYSALDGLSTSAEIAARAAADGNPAVAITDHGTPSGHPQFQRDCDAAGVKPIFGLEGYFIDGDRTERPEKGDAEAQKRLRANRHLILLAQNDQGLHDLWAASTEASRTGGYYKPRMDWELLEQYGSHLIATSSCLGGVLSRQLSEGDVEGAWRIADRMKATFPGRFYLEIQGNGLREQRTLNQRLVQLGEAMGIPLVAAADSHYPGPEQAGLHTVWMSCAAEGSNPDYWNYVHMQTENEMRAALGYLDPQVVDRAVHNTVLIAEQCDARIRGVAKPPVFLPGGTAADDARHLLRLCEEGLRRVSLSGGTLSQYLDRLEREWVLVARKGMAGCYLIVEDVCRWVREQGLVQSFRGSAAGSLMSYLIGITCLDPLVHGLMFERFLTPGRTALPDFDMDFASSARPAVTGYVVGKYGEDKVVRVGTALRYLNKGILQKLFSIMSDKLPGDSFADQKLVAGIIDEAESHTAGLGLTWGELWEQQGDALSPYAEKYPSLFEAASHLAGRVRAYGQHPAGLVISTDGALIDQLPMRMGDSGQMISQFDFRDLEARGLLKLDFLTIRTLDSIQHAINLIEERWHVRPDPFSWSTEYTDPDVWDAVGTGHTLGMFQVETSLGQASCRRMQPRNLADLSELIALVRPGPRNSGMAESYFRRRAGAEEVAVMHPRLEEHLAGQYGLMIFQEDVLRACTELAGYDGAEADEVRKLLGKKKLELIEAAGEKFIARCAANGVPEEESRPVWANMAEYAKYGFNKSHSVSYSVLSFWTAWLKTHYPVEMLTGILATLTDKDRMGEFVTESRRLGVEVRGPDVNAVARGFRPEGVAIRYGLDAIKHVGPAAVNSLAAHQPYSSYEDFLARSSVNMGVIGHLARAGALDSLTASRRGLVEALESDRTGASIRCTWKDPRWTGLASSMEPCRFDWNSEPDPEPRFGKSGRQLAVKPLAIPTRCTRSCRHYTPPEPPSREGTPEYDPARLWRIEQSIFGCWLSPALFEQIDKITPGLRTQARDLALRLPTVKPGVYPVIAVMSGIHDARTRRGTRMSWLQLATEVSYIDIAVFEPRMATDTDWRSLLMRIPEGTLVFAEIEKTRYWLGGWRESWHLRSIEPFQGE